MQNIHANELTPKQYKQNMKKKHPNIREQLILDVKRLIPSFPSNKPSNLEERTNVLLNLLKAATNDKTTPNALPLLVCSRIIEDEEIDLQSKEQAEDTFQKILQKARTDEVEDIYSLDF